MYNLHSDEAAAHLRELEFVERICLDNGPARLCDLYRSCAGALPVGHPWRRNLRLMGREVEMDLWFLRRHPECLFQQMYNRCWWYDAPQAAAHSERTDDRSGEAPWERVGPKLCSLMDEWRQQWERRGETWIRSRRPLPFGLDSALITTINQQDLANDVAYAPDGRVAVAEWGGRVCVWEPETGERLLELTNPGDRAMSVLFSPDGDELLTAFRDGLVRLWDASTGQLLGQVSCGGQVEAIAYTEDGAPLAASVADELASGWTIASVWSVRTGLQLCSLEEHPSPVAAVTFSADARTVATGCDDGSIRLWKMPIGELGREIPAPEGDTHRGVDDLSFSADGQTLAVSFWDGTLQLLNTSIGPFRLELRGASGKVYSLTFSPDGRFFAAGSGDGLVRVWSIQTGEQIDCLPVRTSFVWGLSFSPDGRTLASASSDGAVRFWAVGSEVGTSEAESCFNN